MPRYKVGYDVYDIPEESVEEFLLDFPEAVLEEEVEENIQIDTFDSEEYYIPR